MIMLRERVQTFMEHPKRSLFQLAGPMILGMLVQTFYNLVDTAFVGRLGATAIAALTLSLPFFFVLIALGSGLSAGIGSRLSRYLGEHDGVAAENTALHGLLLSLVLAVVVMVAGNMSLRFLVSLFGATGEVADLAFGYTSIVLSGAIFMLPAQALTSIFAAQGDAKTTMKLQIAALLANIILDPLLIFRAGLGVKGAAIATVGAWAFWLLMSIVAAKRVSHLRIHFSLFRFSPPLLGNMVAVGAPASLVMLLMAVYVMAVNRLMAHFGTEHVASFGMVTRLESVVILPTVGISIALLTLVGIFRGAKRFDLIRRITHFALTVVILISSAIGVFVFFSPWTLRLFTSDDHLLSIAAGYLKIDTLTFPLMAITIAAGRIFQGMGHGLPDFVINLIRVFGVALPLAYFFVFFMNYSYLSIPVAMVLGGLVGSAVAMVWLYAKMRRLDAEVAKEQ